VLGSLAALGYDAEWHCIPACAVGAPHRRDRVWIVADASRAGGRARGQSDSTRQEIAHRSIEMADAERMRKLQPQGSQCHEWRRLSDCSWWNIEPELGRVAHGVPHRVDRLRGLGNAVVPQIVHWLGEQIMKVERENLHRLQRDETSR
jgi:DNA (cytosine-5)-methyltransferase 1